MKVAFKRKDVTLVLPVNPEVISLRYNTRTVNVSTMNLGNVELPRGTQPREITMSGIVFGEGRNLPRLSAWSAEEVKQQIEEWIGARQVRCIIPQTDINFPVIVQAFEPDYRDAHFDVRYTLDLIEARSLTARTFGNAPTQEESTPAEETDSVVNEKQYTVKRGDTLWGIAKDYYGDGSMYKEIQRANSDTIRDPELIQPGWELLMP